MARLRKEGYSIVLRSAGSHSPIDVIGIDPKKNLIKLIQCKTGSTTRTEMNRVWSELWDLFTENVYKPYNVEVDVV